MAKRKTIPAPPSRFKRVIRNRRRSESDPVPAELEARKAAKAVARKAARRCDKANATVKAGGAPMTLTQVHQALVLRAGSGLSPKVFAKKVWPKAPGWNGMINTGNGPHKKPTKRKGGAMNIAGGAALGKLYRAGWATFKIDEDGRTKLYRLTAAGRKALDCSKKAHGL